MALRIGCRPSGDGGDVDTGISAGLRRGARASVMIRGRTGLDAVAL